MGDIVAGKYRVDRVLGVGGMGIVLKATHLDLEQQVAMKFVRRDLAADEDSNARFVLEARAAAKIKNEHACKVLDVDRLDDGTPYIVMELLEGRDLSELLAAHERFSSERAVDWVLEACEGIAEAHASGIVHRDLKPENLFLARRPDGSEVLKVLDFGISKQLGLSKTRSLTSPSTLLGSPHYMAPEQMLANDVDERCDIWALGAILYELIAGVPAFRGDSVPELCTRVLGEAPVPPTLLVPGLSPGLERVILACLSKDREARFPHVAALARELESFGSGSRGQASRRVRALRQLPDLALVPSSERELVRSAVVATSSDLERVQQAHATTQLGGSLGRSRRFPLVTAGVGLLAVVALLRWFFARGGDVPAAPAPPTLRVGPSSSSAAASPATPSSTPAASVASASASSPTNERVAQAARPTVSVAPTPLPGHRPRAHRTGVPKVVAPTSAELPAPPLPRAEPERSPKPADAWNVENFGQRR